MYMRIQTVVLSLTLLYTLSYSSYSYLKFIWSTITEHEASGTEVGARSFKYEHDKLVVANG